MYSSWEEKHLSKTHLLQASIRNLQTSRDRDEQIDILGKIRIDEYDMLNKLIQFKSL